MYIQKNTSNIVVLTLNEKATSNSHYWLFEFTSGQNGTVKYCIAEDISNYTDRYNEFVIVDNSTEDAYNGTLNLHSGSWDYKVYEMPVSSPPSLDPSGYLAIVETGAVVVRDPNENTNINFDADDNKNNVSFNG